ncbi:uncharacterized protein PHALS_09110 [Plasmopara halstedii]|uniref:Uncharacterized protein n=1 Tax=Plasmopara halstedii TaxID=4781 RepID=A0A0P1AEG7_PLAHL|nr:uncharacterized protein PHALS_09110 [Plasmopara halstedii]CEG39046.1 hypothetical protein PHALS_09110 [Plasmopara halstedii]|eukprot:XP_024575415.1 hypothetical protein PHALS_09110 [Plasmopara halstedii]
MGGVVIAVYTPVVFMLLLLALAIVDPFYKWRNEKFDTLNSLTRLAHEAELPTWSTLHIRHEQRF